MLQIHSIGLATPPPVRAQNRFPVGKYPMLLERVLAAQLGVVHDTTEAGYEDLRHAHTVEYIERMLAGQMSEAEMRRIGFPWSLLLVQRVLRSVGATIATCRSALLDGVSVSLVGGTHHAYADHGEGFCVFNDSVIAARILQAERLTKQVVVIDLDVHQGNGTAALAAHDPTLFAFSVHGASNYPFHKEQGDLDIALPDGTGDDAYLTALEHGLAEAIEQSRADLAIYLAGADPFEDDTLGRLKLSKSGLLARDRMVLEACRMAGLPVAITMAGGYGRNLADTVDIHYQTVALARQYTMKIPSQLDKPLQY